MESVVSQSERQTTLRGEARACPSLRFTVVIPSYLRPTYLVGCLRALAGQTRPADEVIVVLREDDAESRRALQEFISSEGGRLPVSLRTVTQPGFLPPIAAGIEAAQGDVVAFVDDDAEPLPDWLERLQSHYADPRVGGVGGRCLNMENGREVCYPVAGRVGRFYWFGRALGNMYREVAGSAPRRVDFFMGGNMSYRREALRRVRLDETLNRDVAYQYEVHLGLQVKELGFDLVYDPLAKIRHFSAPRPLGGMRVHGRTSVYFASHNLFYITLKHTSGVQRWLAFAYAFLIGGRHTWGLAAIVAESLRFRYGWWRELGPALQGKIDAVREIMISSPQAPAQGTAQPGRRESWNS